MDLELKDLGQFYGTERYHKALNKLVTDGIKYIMENGYSWFVTDAIVAINTLEDGFKVIKLKVKDNKAEMIITDGDEKILYKQNYDYTDAKRELKLYYNQGVLMLAGEY